MYIEWGRSRGCSDADTEWICSRGGGVAAKKRRWEVLDRLARLGQGLSPAQSLGHNYIKWWVNGCSCGGQLLVAVAACSWPQSRLGVGMQLRVLTRAE